MKHKKEFYSRIIIDNPKSEIASILKENPDCGYYELCQCFLDIALNATIIQKEDKTLSGIFQHTDINVAKKKTIEFLKSVHIADVDAFFSILAQHYPFSASPNDNRRKCGMVQESENSYVGYIGTLYLFTQISDDIYSKIVKEIKEELT